MKRIGLLLLAIVMMAGCGGEDGDDEDALIKAWSSAIQGQGVADAPPYVGGSIPHKIRALGYGLPEWEATSVAEMQLCLDPDLTSRRTGRTWDYGPKQDVPLWHRTLTITLFEVHTGQAIGSRVFEGNNQFPSSIKWNEVYAYDTIDYKVVHSAMIEWLRPFVEQ